MNKAVESAMEYAYKIKDGIAEKAKKNKDFSTFLFAVILVSTVASPILILVGKNFLISKLLPSILTACAALSSYWIQLRKPQDRWVLYRTAQREIEFEIDQYSFSNGEYDTVQDKDKLLSDKVSKRALQLHYEWIPIVPKVEEIKKLLNNWDYVYKRRMPNK